MQFATSLATAGRTTQALTLFASMLRLETDRPTQQAVLRRCLDHCWGTDWSLPGRSAAAAPPLQGARKAWSISLDDRAPAKQLRTRGQLQGTGVPCVPPRRSERHGGGASLRFGRGAASEWVVQVARFGRMQRGMPLSDFVWELQSLGVPYEPLLGLCAELLLPLESSISADSPASMGQCASSLLPCMLQLLADALAGKADESGACVAPESPASAAPRATGRVSGRRRTVAVCTGGVLAVLAPPRLGRALCALAAVIAVGNRP